MPDRVGFPAGVPSWIDTTQPDPAAAASFYGPLFRWEFEERMPPGSDGSYLMAKLDGREVAGISSAMPGSPAAAWNTYVQVDSADEGAATVRAAGGTVVTEPFDVFDAGRMAVCADPAGATFSLWQPGTTQGVEIVNAPGSWNFSELYADDLDAAQRFYGAVFGWEANEVDMGALAGLMVRLPGYADFLEQFDPGIKQRHADFGAPPGFSDCVAWILPLDEGVPHWNVTFSVANTDAVAATAQQHGGTVVVEPLDVPPVRSAVLRDPQGAQFTVSAYAPD